MEKKGASSPTDAQAPATRSSTDEACAARAEATYKTKEELQKMYEKMLDIKGAIGSAIDGGTAFSVDPMTCDGGTTFTTEECEADAGTV